jgi:hypothetical protein
MSNWIVEIAAHPYDNEMFAPVLTQVEQSQQGTRPKQVIVDQGFQGTQ